MRIEKAELIGRKKEIVDRNGHVDYDMYLVKVAYEDGSVKKVRTFSEPGTLDENNKEDVKRFIYDRLEHLMRLDERTNYIFLGRIESRDGEFYTERDYMVNGEEALRVFERDVYDLRDAVNEMERLEKTARKTKKREQAKSNSKGNVKGQKKDDRQNVEHSKGTETNNIAGPKPKQYVISCIYRDTQARIYKRVMSLLNDSDSIIIAGNLVDNYYGIELLDDIMERTRNKKSGPKVQFLLGVSEIQMLKCIDIVDKYDLTPRNVYFDCTSVAYGDRDESQEALEKIRDEIKERMKNSPQSYDSFSEKDARVIFEWLHYGNGMNPMNDYVYGSYERRKEIRQALENGLVMLKVETPGKKHIIVNYSPCIDQSVMDKFAKQTSCALSYKDIKGREKIIAEMFEDRERAPYIEKWTDLGYHVICGGLSLYEKIREQEDIPNSTLIDAKYGYREDLGIYSIEDDKIVYVEETENDRKAAHIVDSHDER